MQVFSTSVLFYEFFQNVDTYEMHELGSLAKALDIQKSLAEESHHIHGEAMRRKQDFHDPEVIYDQSLFFCIFLFKVKDRILEHQDLLSEPETKAV